MKLNELKNNEGARQDRTSVGRGIGSGKGKTCGSGQKGQKARSGVAINGFEGGQMPIYMRMPKSGFNNTRFTRNYAELTTGKLQAAIDAKQIDAKKAIDGDILLKAGVISRKRDGVKLLTKGELKAKVELKIAKATKSAQEAVEKAGGKIDFVETIVAPLEKGKKKEKTKEDRKAKKAKSAKKSK